MHACWKELHVITKKNYVALSLPRKTINVWTIFQLDFFPDRLVKYNLPADNILLLVQYGNYFKPVMSKRVVISKLPSSVKFKKRLRKKKMTV